MNSEWLKQYRECKISEVELILKVDSGHKSNSLHASQRQRA